MLSWDGTKIYDFCELYYFILVELDKAQLIFLYMNSVYLGKNLYVYRRVATLLGSHVQGPISLKKNFIF